MNATENLTPEELAALYARRDPRYAASPEVELYKQLPTDAFLRLRDTPANLRHVDHSDRIVQVGDDIYVRAPRGEDWRFFI